MFGRGYVMNVGRGYIRNVGRGYVIQNSESVGESVTKVVIELLGQLKNPVFTNSLKDFEQISRFIKFIDYD